jgi:Protein of unknown function (DUF3443)
MTRRAAHTFFVALALPALLLLGGCGGGGGGSGSSGSQSVQNVQPVIVDGGPANIPDLVFASVTVCAPGSSSSCQTIDHIQVDTGSTGLRILASVLSPTLSLPQQSDTNGSQLAECAQFVDGFSWGAVRVADVHIAGEQASSVPIQVICDTSFPTIPKSCSGSGPPENTVTTFGANGLLGVGMFLQDCGNACVQAALPGTYYVCPSGACQATSIPLAKQLQHPVAMFGADNNGVAIQLPSIGATGAATASGSLIFGIGTQSDNGLRGATVLAVDPNTGNIVTTFNNKTYTSSYLDAGSSALFFGIAAYPNCVGTGRGFYCPPTIQNLSATLQGPGGGSSVVSFSVANADQLFAANPSFNAFDNLAAPSGDTTTFAWGLPLFYGRTVFTAIEGRSTPGGMGPYVAF